MAAEADLLMVDFLRGCFERQTGCVGSAVILGKVPVRIKIMQAFFELDF